MKRLKLTVFFVLILMLVSGLLFGVHNKQARAAGKAIEITFATPWSNPNPYAVAAKMWIDKIEKDTNGRVQIKPYWGGTLINPREAFVQLSNGVFDTGWCCIAYVADGFTLSTNYMPFYYGISDTKVRRRIDAEVRKKFPVLNEEYSKWKILELVGGNNNQLISVNPVRKVADIKGMSMKGGGPDIEVIKKLGGEGARVSMGEVYISLQKKILDGAFVPWETFVAFKFGEIVKYVNMVNTSYSPYPQNFMNLKVWNKLPADIQKVFDDNIEFWNNAEDEAFRVANEAGMKAAKEAGVEFIEFPPEESKKFFDTFAEVTAKIAADLDAKGYPGTDILNEVTRLSKIY